MRVEHRVQNGDRTTFTSSVFFLNHQGQLLLIHHKRFGLWLPPGGEIETKETPRLCAMRELREETGITDSTWPRVSPVDGTPSGFIGYEEHDAAGKGVHLNFVFLVLAGGTWNGKVVSDGSWEGHRFVNLEDVRAIGEATTKNVIDTVDRIILIRRLGSGT